MIVPCVCTMAPVGPVGPWCPAALALALLFSGGSTRIIGTVVCCQNWKSSGALDTASQRGYGPTPAKPVHLVSVGPGRPATSAMGPVRGSVVAYE